MNNEKKIMRKTIYIPETSPEEKEFVRAIEAQAKKEVRSFSSLAIIAIKNYIENKNKS